MKVDLVIPATRNMSVAGDTLEIDLDPDALVEGVADAISEVVKDAISDQPGDKWDKTGTLRRGIRASDGEVFAPPNRLNRDDLAERFADEVMPDDVTADARVTVALKAGADAMVK